MTPETIATIAALVEKYGLPLTILGVFGWLLFTRRLVLGSEKDRSDATYEAALHYRDERRMEEREGRLAAEAALREAINSVIRLSEGLDSTTDAILDAIEGREARRGPRR